MSKYQLNLDSTTGEFQLVKDGKNLLDKEVALTTESLNLAGTKNTNIPVVPPNDSGTIKYQAEQNITFSGCTITSVRPGFEGTGYLKYDVADAYAEWKIYRFAEKAKLDIKYANGGPSSRPCKIIVNGKEIKTLDFKVTGGWGMDKSGVESLDIILSEGENTIRIQSSSASGPNIDCFTITPKPSIPDPEPTPEPTPIPEQPSAGSEFKPPFPFKDDNAARNWYRAYFMANTGCRIPKNQLKVVSGFKAKSNETYKGLYIVNNVDLSNTENVKFIDCIIDGNTYCVKTPNSTCKNALFSWCTLFSCNSAASFATGTKGAPLVFENVEVYDSAGDGFKPQSWNVFKCVWIHNIGTADGAHADAIQIRDAGNIEVDLMYSDIPIDVPNTSSNAALFLQTGANNVKVRRLVTEGGNYVITADCKNFDIDQWYHFENSARHGRIRGTNSDDKVGKIYSAITGKEISTSGK